MKDVTRGSTRFLCLLMVTLLPLTGGCQWDDDDDDEDFIPPEGQGALRVDNNTGDDIRVYIDGALLGTTGDYSDRAFPLDPGLYRVVLDQKNGDRNYRDDVDIIVGRLTVLDIEVDNDFFDGDYDVEVFFD